MAYKAMAYNTYGKLLLPSNLKYNFYRKSCSIVNIENVSADKDLYINIKVITPEVLEQLMPEITSFDDIEFLYDEPLMLDMLNTNDGVYKLDLTITQDNTTIIYCYRLNETPTNYFAILNFCKLLECRLNLLNRLLGELDNCKEECDCTALYDFNAFNILYESILAIISGFYSEWPLIYNVTSITDIQVLTNLSELLKQAEKYCIECVKPCKDC